MWTGRGCTQDEKKKAMMLASQYLGEAEPPRPNWTPITKVFEGSETAAFKSHLLWQARKVDFSKRASVGVAAAPEQQSADELATAMKAKAAREAQAVSEDEGSGKAEVWRVEDMDKVSVEEAMHGQFFDGDSYVILYSYTVGGRDQFFIYFWRTYAPPSAPPALLLASLATLHLLPPAPHTTTPPPPCCVSSSSLIAVVVVVVVLLPVVVSRPYDYSHEITDH